MRILLNFIQDNRLRLVDWFNQFDKDHSGGISRDEFKIGLRETGLVMTQVANECDLNFCMSTCDFLVTLLSIFFCSSDNWIV